MTNESFGFMGSMRRRLIAYAGPVLLIGLLLAPIVAYGHGHAAHASAPQSHG